MLMALSSQTLQAFKKCINMFYVFHLNNHCKDINKLLTYFYLDTINNDPVFLYMFFFEKSIPDLNTLKNIKGCLELDLKKQKQKYFL